MKMKRTVLLAIVFILLFASILESSSGFIIIPKGTLVKIRLEQSLDTRTNKTGDMVSFSVVDPVRIGKKLVIKKGAFAQAQLEKVRRPGRFGRNGSLKIRYLFVTGANRTHIPITLGEKAAKTNESMGFAAGASAAGYMIFGPVGLVGSVFVRGKDIDIRAGTVLMVELPKEFRF